MNQLFQFLETHPRSFFAEDKEKRFYKIGLTTTIWTNNWSKSLMEWTYYLSSLITLKVFQYYLFNNQSLFIFAYFLRRNDKYNLLE